MDIRRRCRLADVGHYGTESKLGLAHIAADVGSPASAAAAGIETRSRSKSSCCGNSRSGLRTAMGAPGIEPGPPRVKHAVLRERPPLTHGAASLHAPSARDGARLLLATNPTSRFRRPGGSGSTWRLAPSLWPRSLLSSSTCQSSIAEPARPPCASSSKRNGPTRRRLLVRV
jgi:hypothetical protein